MKAKLKYSLSNIFLAVAVRVSCNKKHKFLMMKNMIT